MDYEYNEGERAALAGLPSSYCPYSGFYPTLRTRWIIGWIWGSTRLAIAKRKHANG